MERRKGDFQSSVIRSKKAKPILEIDAPPPVLPLFTCPDLEKYCQNIGLCTEIISWLQNFELYSLSG